MALYLLFEAASGYALFEVEGMDELAQETDALQQTVGDMSRFGRVVKLMTFKAFQSAADALEQCNAVAEGSMTEDLRHFLEMNLPKVKKDGSKKPKWRLGVTEAKLGSAIQETTGIPCQSNEFTGEVLRGVRMHLPRFLKQLEETDITKAQLGLAHAFSRSKVKFNVNRVDNMIIQAIALLDTLDKDINTFVMRVREWYSWHFPELVKLVNDNYQYAKLALLIKDKTTLAEDKVPEMTEILGDDQQAAAVVEAAKTSMGQDISPIDLINIETFAKRVISLAEYRQRLHTYLLEKMHVVAPNLSALIGEVVGARLISHAGSLTNLAKYPASTVQILGAEKALFRALKTKGNTPKYGLIFHSSFIGRAKQRNKGRISRYLANKCSIASRIDCFSELASSAFGDKMKEQVEDRLRFYEEGVAPKKNITAMQEVIQSLATATDMDLDDAEPASDKKKKKKKKKDMVAEATAEAAQEVTADQTAGEAAMEAEAAVAAAEPHKKKKSKKRAADAEVAASPADMPTKKKKKKAKAST